MKSERSILAAFVLNLAFSVFEIFGGIFCGSVAIMSDAIHDMGDAASIGIAYFLERKSREKADKVYTYGYARCSVLGGLITSAVLLFSSFIVIFNAVRRILTPVAINYNGMIVFAVVGFVVNLAAVILTHKGDSLNERAISLHMLEDVLGWAVVLCGAIIMRFWDIAILDPLMSVAVSVFILINAAKTANKAIALFLEKAPSGIDAEKVAGSIKTIDGVSDVHHIHIWSIDERNACATLHVVTNSEAERIKEEIRCELSHMGISHVTIEVDNENCAETECIIDVDGHSGCCHNH